MENELNKSNFLQFFRGPFLTEKKNSLKIPAIVRSCLLVHHSQHWERYPLEDLKIGYLPEMVMAH